LAGRQRHRGRQTGRQEGREAGRLAGRLTSRQADWLVQSHQLTEKSVVFYSTIPSGPNVMKLFTSVIHKFS
jgi:hypothetical protein